MQNQKTAPLDIDADNLPPLSVQEQRLIEALGQGDSNTEAYRKAYGAEGYSQASLHVRACVKVAQSHIQAHLVRLRSVGLNRAVISLQQRMEAELAFAQRAEAAGNFGAAGGAYDRLNKLMGLYVERLEVSAADPLETLRQIAQVSPDLAASLAASQGIPWQPKPAPQADETATMH